MRRTSVLLVFMLIVLGLTVTGCRSVPVAKKPAGRVYQKIVIQKFSLDGAAIQDNVDIKAFANGLPEEFARNIKEYLEAMDVTQKIEITSKDINCTNCLIVKGSFTKITAGSTAARMLVGFGAGASTVGAKWQLIDKDTNKTIGSFEKNSHTSSSARGMAAVQSDSRHLARHIARNIQGSL